MARLPPLCWVYRADEQVMQLDVRRRITAQFIMKGVTLSAPTVHKKTSQCSDSADIFSSSRDVKRCFQRVQNRRAEVIYLFGCVHCSPPSAAHCGHTVQSVVLCPPDDHQDMFRTEEMTNDVTFH